MSVSLLTVWRAARARAVPFAGESAGYLVLLASEELAAAPREVALQSVLLNVDGRVTLGGKEPASETRAEAELRTVFRKLLEVASSPGVSLTRLSARPSSGTLSAFTAELAKALIPLNHAAARRALGRLYRETQRADMDGRFSDAAEDDVPVEAEPAPTRPEALAAPPSPVLLPPAGPREVALHETQRIAAIRAPSPQTLAALAPPEGSEHPTRPETVVARRALVPLPIDSKERETADGEQTRDDYEETPRLGTLTASCDVVTPRDTLISELAEGELTEGAPAVFEFEVPLLELETGQWPVELADSNGAIPLEEERDALREPELSLESPLRLSSLPLAVKERTIHEVPTLRPEPPREELPAESYPGMPPDRSDVRELLKGFQVAAVGEKDVAAELRSLAGVDAVPEPAPRARRR